MERENILNRELSDFQSSFSPLLIMASELSPIIYKSLHDVGAVF